MTASAAGRAPAAGVSRSRQGLVLWAGAFAFVLAVGSSRAAFWWTPLGIGLAYLASATAGGRRGRYWATALVLTGWGAGVLIAHDARPTLDVAGVYLAGAGVGALAAALAARRGFAVDLLGVAATIAAAGFLLALEPQWSSVLGEARTYGVAVGLVGLANHLWGVFHPRDA